MPKLNICYHPDRNGCDVYYPGEEPGSSSEPRASEIEDTVMEWAEFSSDINDTEYVKWAITRMAKHIVPSVEVEVHIL